MMVSSFPHISTDHLSAATCTQLDDWCRTIDIDGRRAFSVCPTLMAATDYGWFVRCCEEQCDLPDDLWACLQWAGKVGHDYVLFDADGDDVEELPNLGGPTEANGGSR